LERALKKLRALGNGYGILTVGGRRLVQSVPTELNTDHVAVLSQAAAEQGRVTVASVAKALSWAPARIMAALDQLIQDGMIWVDDQTGDGLRAYWFPSLASRFRVPTPTAGGTTAAAGAADPLVSLTKNGSLLAK
jgi:ESCRT-II complex subunit VPS22